jgi:hypothetical protein
MQSDGGSTPLFLPPRNAVILTLRIFSILQRRHPERSEGSPYLSLPPPSNAIILTLRILPPSNAVILNEGPAAGPLKDPVFVFAYLLESEQRDAYTIPPSTRESRKKFAHLAKQKNTPKESIPRGIVHQH